VASPQVAVCGPADCTDAEFAAAREVGRLLAARGAVVICGGGAGVMSAVAAGASAAGGFVVGIRPDGTPGAPGLSATVVTNMGEARNAVIVASADAVIAVGGSWGTLSEVALAMRRGDIPVVSLGGWRILDGNGDPVAGVRQVSTPAEAVRAALDA
jgi:uncharacterized protein (TIGR00725 family)